jgi:sulfoxide reductase heme-binding subunit YedZ
VAASSREEKRKRGLLYIVLTGIAGAVLVAISIGFRPAGTVLDLAVRATAMLGYFAIFLTAVTSAYMRELFQLLGRPFIRVHHVYSVAGLILITLHPLGVAVRSSDILVFLPDFSSFYQFFSLGGRPAWYLIGIASLGALFRTTIRKRWRLIHYLNYVAFLLATVHAMLSGTDFFSLGMKAIPAAMGLVVLGVLIRKHIQRRNVRRRRIGEPAAG